MDPNTPKSELVFWFCRHKLRQPFFRLPHLCAVWVYGYDFLLEHLMENRVLWVTFEDEFHAFVVVELVEILVAACSWGAGVC
jgi:hypothetical protein